MNLREQWQKSILKRQEIDPNSKSIIEEIFKKRNI